MNRFKVLYWTSKSKSKINPKSKKRNGKKGRPSRATGRRKSRKEKSGDERILIEIVGRRLGIKLNK